jgi:hypothetical protein
MKLKRKLQAIILYLRCPTLNFLRYLCNIRILWKFSTSPFGVLCFIETYLHLGEFLWTISVRSIVCAVQIKSQFSSGSILTSAASRLEFVTTAVQIKSRFSSGSILTSTASILEFETTWTPYDSIWYGTLTVNVMSTVRESTSINTSLNDMKVMNASLNIPLCSVNKHNALKARKSGESAVLCDVCETSERPFTSKRIGTKISKSEFYTENDLMMCFYWCYGKWRLLKTSFGRICKTIRDTRKISEFNDRNDTRKRIDQLSIRIQLI